MTKINIPISQLNIQYYTIIIVKKSYIFQYLIYLLVPTVIINCHHIIVQSS